MNDVDIDKVILKNAEQIKDESHGRIFFNSI